MANIIFSDETKKLIKEFVNNTEDYCLSDYRKPDNPEKAQVQGDYFQIIRKGSDWRKIDFHFEIAWWKYKGKTKIDNVDKVDILVHLETTDENILNFFKKKSGVSVKPRQTEKRSYYQIGEPVTLNVDFTPKEKAIKSLENIIAVLETKSFSDLADLADDYLNSEV